MKWSHQFQFAGYYAAKHKGFYQAKGLDVTIKVGGPEVEVNEEVNSGRANFGVLASELILKRAQGESLVLLATIMQHSNRVIIVRADSGVDSPADLVDRRMMLNRNEDAEFMAMFLAEGIPLNKLKIIPKDETAIDQFVSGEIDAFNGSIGNQPFIFQSLDIPVKTISPISYGIDFYGDALFTSEKEIKNHPDRVAAFRAASLLGWEYALQNSDEIIDLIIAEYNPDKSRAQLQFEAIALRKLILPDLVYLGHNNPQRIQRIAEVYAKRHIIPKNLSLDGFIYDPKPVSNTERIQRLRAGFAVFAFIGGLGGLVLVFFNRRLKKSVDQRTKELSQKAKELSAQIIEREQLEEELLKSKKQLLIASSLANVGGWEIDLLGHTVRWSPETFRIYELPENYAPDVSKSIRFYHPDDRQMVNDVVQHSIETGEGFDFEARLITARNNLKWVRAVGRTISDNGKTIGVRGMVQDITKRKQAEAELIKHRDHLEELIHSRTFELAQSRDAAEAANRAKSVFLTTMSHELRTPLNGVMGLTDLALGRATDALQIDWLNKSQTSAKHLLDILNDILNLSKIEANALTLKESDFCLAQTIDDSLQLHSAAANAKGLDLSCEIDTTLPGTLRGDALQLKQILLNYISNAIKFSDSGKITVRAIAMEQDRQKVLLKLEVSDQGIGISPEKIGRLFKPFIQTDDTLTRQYGGTGLGLAISKRIAMLMGGDAGVESTVGAGSTFWATVWLRKQQGKAAKSEAIVADEARAEIHRGYPGHLFSRFASKHSQ